MLFNLSLSILSFRISAIIGNPHSIKGLDRTSTLGLPARSTSSYSHAPQSTSHHRRKGPDGFGGLDPASLLDPASELLPASTTIDTASDLSTSCCALQATSLSSTELLKSSTMSSRNSITQTVVILSSGFLESASSSDTSTSVIVPHSSTNPVQLVSDGSTSQSPHGPATGLGTSTFGFPTANSGPATITSGSNAYMTNTASQEFISSPTQAGGPSTTVSSKFILQSSVNSDLSSTSIALLPHQTASVLPLITISGNIYTSTSVSDYLVVSQTLFPAGPKNITSGTPIALVSGASALLVGIKTLLLSSTFASYTRSGIGGGMPTSQPTNAATESVTGTGKAPSKGSAGGVTKLTEIWCLGAMFIVAVVVSL